MRETKKSRHPEFMLGIWSGVGTNGWTTRHEMLKQVQHDGKGETWSGVGTNGADYSSRDAERKLSMTEMVI